MEDAATYARDEDFDILSQDGSTLTPASDTTIRSSSPRGSKPVDHRPWAKGAAQASTEDVGRRSGLFSFLSKREPAAPSVRKVHAAFRNTDLETIKAWLEAGGSANAPIHIGSQRALPLEWVVMFWSSVDSRRNTRILKGVELLIEYGADVNRAYECYFPFHLAMLKDANGSGELMQYFLDNGADHGILYDPSIFKFANGVLPTGWETPTASRITMLEGVCDEGYATAILLLIKAGAKVDWQTSEGKTPLHRLASCKNPSGHNFHVWDTLIKEFIKAGADINAVSETGDTPLLSAMFPHQYRSLDMVKALVMNGAWWDYKNQYGETMFHRLVVNGQTYRWFVDSSDFMCCRCVANLGIESFESSAIPHLL
jgi:ankyrin repeat protein